MKARAPILQTVGLTARYGDRLLFAELNLCLEFDKVALIGRNGVGKSTLLQLLGGEMRAGQGTVTQRGRVFLVRQMLAAGSQSPGQQRREHLQQAMAGGFDLLLLDEPTQDLDDESVAWLRSCLASWDRGLLVATHDRRLLGDFHHFFLMAESGCRYLSGTFELLEQELEKEFRGQEERYLRRLSHLSKVEEHTLQSARRRKRKKQYGRVREIDRATSRARLNLKRDQAQVSHGRINSLREERLGEVRDWTRSARRHLKVVLPLELEMPKLPPATTTPVRVAQGISSVREGRCLFQGMTLSLGRDRVAVTGPNGAGKTTLLQVLAGVREPDTGTVRVDLSRLGVVEQGGLNWMLDDALADYLARFMTPEAVGRSLVADKFPLALAQRPLRTLSPGERVRAALLALQSHDPPVELLILDEPTYSLDLLGQKALGDFLRAWPGGLVIASHNSDFLKSCRMETTLTLGHRA
jgi:ATPase subunit of ABC transporter with duplicated ATPase domains